MIKSCYESTEFFEPRDSRLVGSLNSNNEIRRDPLENRWRKCTPLVRLQSPRFTFSQPVSASRSSDTAIRKWWHPLWYRLVMRASLAWFHGPCEGDIRGLDHVLPLLDSGCIIAANHVSYLDWMVLHSVFYYGYQRRLVFLAKNKLFSHPLWASLMTESQSVRVSDTGDAILDRSGFRQLRNNPLVAIFPEGMRSSAGIVQAAHLGAVKLAARLKRPIVPTALTGFYESWPTHKVLPRPAPCAINFGVPLEIPATCARDDELAKDFTAKLMNNIKSAKS